MVRSSLRPLMGKCGTHLANASLIESEDKLLVVLSGLYDTGKLVMCACSYQGKMSEGWSSLAGTHHE